MASGPMEISTGSIAGNGRTGITSIQSASKRARSAGPSKRREAPVLPSGREAPVLPSGREAPVLPSGREAPLLRRRSPCGRAAPLPLFARIASLSGEQPPPAGFGGSHGPDDEPVFRRSRP